MQVFKYCLFAGMFYLLLTSCNKMVDSGIALRTYVQLEENELSKQKTIGVVKVQVNFHPTDLLVEQQLRQNTPTSSLIDSLRRQYGAYVYFLLNLSANGKEIETWNHHSQKDYSNRIETLAFGMNKYVRLSTDNEDTMPLIDYNYQRTFGVGGSTDLLFVFDKEKLLETDWVQFQLQDFGLGIGTTSFRFKTTDLTSLPEIAFEALN